MAFPPFAPIVPLKESNNNPPNLNIQSFARIVTIFTVMKVFLQGLSSSRRQDKTPKQPEVLAVGSTYTFQCSIAFSPTCVLRSMAGRAILSLTQWILSLGTARNRLGDDHVTHLPVIGMRLSGDMRPVHYDLGIRTDLETLRFWGAETVSIETVRTTDRIDFHADCNLKISSISVCFAQHYCIEIPSQAIHRDCSARTLTLLHPTHGNFEIGESFSLILSWSGEINEYGKGYMRSPDVGFETSGYSAVTKFEPVEARAVLPSWDEPAYKASFQITLVGRSETVNLANMDMLTEEAIYGDTELNQLETLLVQDIELDGSWKASHFRISPKMSPHNVAWGNGRYRSLESSYFSDMRNETVPTAVRSNEVDVSSQAWLLHIIDTVTPLCETIFSLAYPLPKLDWLATPAYKGAIETWGLITGGSGVTEWKEGDGDDQKAFVVNIGAHEIAHQWFGNIVTMEWWDDLWLSEAFSTWAAVLLLGPRIMPDFSTWLSFTNNELERAMTLDARTSHPIIQPVENEAQLGMNADSLTYDKGASILRMLAGVIGEEKLIAGVSRYLNKYAYGNTIGTQVWQEMAHFSDNLDMQAFGDAWTRQAGFPVVLVERLGGRKFRLTQSRYLSKGRPTGEETDQTWPIPLFAIPQALGAWTTPIMWDTSMELTISGSEQLVLNRDRLGFYRVMYDKPGYTWMRQQFLNRSSHLSGVDRAGFLADMVAFASSGRMETTEVMDMLNHLSGETDSLVWEVAAGFMTQLRSLLWEEDEVIQRSLANWMGDIIADTVDSIGFETRKGDTASIQKIRQELLPLMGYAGSPRYLAYSVDILAQVCQGQLESAAGISGSALRAVMGTAVRHGGEKQWISALQLYTRKGSGYAGQALYALAQSPNLRNLESLIDMLSNGTLLDRDDRQSKSAFIQSMLSNPAGRRPMTEYLWDNLDNLLTELDTLGIDRVIITFFSQLSSKQDLERCKQRLTGGKYTAYEASLRTLFEEIEDRGDWLERDGEAISDWLLSRS